MKSRFHLLRSRCIHTFGLPQVVALMMLFVISLGLGGSGTNVFTSAVYGQESESESGAGESGTDVEIKIEGVEVGTRGVYKVGFWSPVEVTFSASAPGAITLELATIDADGAPFTITSDPHQISAAGTHTLTGKFLPGRMEADLTVRLLQNGKLLAERVFPSSRINADSLPVAERQSVFLVGVIHPSADGANTEADASDTSADWPRLLVERQEASMSTTKPTPVLPLASVDELPNDLDTLRTFDALIISDDFDLPPEREKLIQQWVKTGGHLVVSIGKKVEQWKEGSLSKWVPVQVDGTINLKHLGDMENFAGKGRLVRIIMDVARIRAEDLDAKVLVSSIEGPLVVQSSYGFGKTTVSAIDLTREPLASWESLPLFFQKVFNRVPEEAGGENGSGARNLVHSGVGTLRTQLQGTLDRFESTRNLSAWEVMVRILGLIVLLGPLDYLLTHKLLKRPGLTWISFPLMLGIVILLTLRTAESMHHEEPLLREVSLLDHDAQSGLSRYRVWHSYYSPESNRVDLAVDPVGETTASSTDYVVAPRTRWSGTPEENFSGMYRPPGISLGMPAYQLALDKSEMSEIPIGQWSSKVVETEWIAQASENSLVESDLTMNSGGRLRGSIKHHLPVPLKKWFIAHGNDVYFSNDNSDQSISNALAPDETFEVDTFEVVVRTIKNYLTGRVGDPDRYEQDVLATELRQYEVDSLDPYLILRAMSFYEIVGGLEYYSVSNEAWTESDFSSRMDMKRAMLFGEVDLPVVTTSIDDEPMQPVYQKALVRIVVPVK